MVALGYTSSVVCMHTIVVSSKYNINFASIDDALCT